MIPDQPRGRAPERDDNPRPKAKAKAKSRARSIAETIAYPEHMDVILPISEPKPPAKVRKTALKVKKLIDDVGEASAPKPKAEPTKPRGRPRKVPDAAPPTRKPRVRKVKIDEAPVDDLIVKRGRGRPKGSLGKKKRDALLEAEFRKVSAVQL